MSDKKECVWTRKYYPFLGMGYYATDCGYAYEGNSTNPVLTADTAPKTCKYCGGELVLSSHTKVQTPNI